MMQKSAPADFTMAAETSPVCASSRAEIPCAPTRTGELSRISATSGMKGEGAAMPASAPRMPRILRRSARAKSRACAALWMYIFQLPMTRRLRDTVELYHRSSLLSGKALPGETQHLDGAREPGGGLEEGVLEHGEAAS